MTTEQQNTLEDVIWDTIAEMEREGYRSPFRRKIDGVLLDSVPVEPGPADRS